MYFSVPLWSRFWIPLISGIQRAEQIMGFPSVLLDLSINHIVVIIAEIIVHTSANGVYPDVFSRDVSALRTKNKENTTLIFGPGTSVASRMFFE